MFSSIAYTLYWCQEKNTILQTATAVFTVMEGKDMDLALWENDKSNSLPFLISLLPPHSAKKFSCQKLFLQEAKARQK